MAVVIVALDTTVLNVAIPTILREFDTTLPSLQWVITGYALTFASLLIIGGRLGDIFGHRRMFIIGAAMFGFGSLIAALSQNVGKLVLGEAIIEGMGASLMMPATLAILSTSFVGRERATAFGIWGAVGGASGALGPVVGGSSRRTSRGAGRSGSTSSSPRWRSSARCCSWTRACARRSASRSTSRARCSSPRACSCSSSGSARARRTDGEAAARLHRRRRDDLAGDDAGVDRAVAFVLSPCCSTSFVRVERSKERRDAAPLFEFGELRHRGFRYGLLITVVISLGQFGLSFVLPIFLQEGKQLSAQENGLWQLPLGLMVLVGAQVGSRMIHHIGILTVIRLGLTSAAVGFIYIAFSARPRRDVPTTPAGMILYGLGFGLSIAQLTNVVLSDVSPENRAPPAGRTTPRGRSGSRSASRSSARCCRRARSPGRSTACRAAR